MNTYNNALAVDVLAVLRQIADGEGDAQVLAMRVHAAAADLIEAAHAMSAVLHEYGQYDDGCFYYCGLSSPELERPLSVIDSALARVKGESA
ncbi:hypothetical protein [Stenotrophomonas sepilia]